MHFNTSKLKEFKKKMFITVHKVGILLLFQACSEKTLGWGWEVSHILGRNDFLVPRCSWEGEKNHQMLKQRNTTVCGSNEALEGKLLSSGVCTSHPFQLMINWKSYRNDHEVCRSSIIVAYLINSIYLFMAIGKYDLSVNRICKLPWCFKGRLIYQL